MKRTGLLLCICISIVVFVTGCWNRRELNELAIAVGMGIDKSGDQYEVSVQVVEPSEVAGKKEVHPRQSPCFKRRDLAY